MTGLQIFLITGIKFSTCDGTSSDTENVRSGVPQGSVMAPFYPICVSMTLRSVKTALIGSISDENILTKVIYSQSIEEDMFHLSDDPKSFSRWAIANNMELNQSKFDLL